KLKPAATKKPAPGASTVTSSLRDSDGFDKSHGTQACGLCAKRTFCPLSARMEAERNSAGRTDLEVYVPYAGYDRLAAQFDCTQGRLCAPASLQSQVRNLKSRLGSPGWRNWQTRQT